MSPDATGDLVNTATATAGAGSTDTNAGNNSATDTDTPGVSQVDLAIAKTDGQTAYVPGTPISYTITVTNAGPSTATGVTITDPVPAAITGVIATCTATGTDSCGTNASAGNNVSFTGATLAPGAGHALTLTVNGTISPDASGPLVNAATVTAGPGSTDPSLGNNTATDTDTLGDTQVDLAITKTDGQTTYVPGTPITYTIAVTNAGPSHAGSFTITDLVPATITGVTDDLRGHRHGQLRHQRVVGQRRQLDQCEPRPGRGQYAHAHHQRHGQLGCERHADQYGHGRGSGCDRHEPGQQQRDRHELARHVAGEPGHHQDGAGQRPAWRNGELHAHREQCRPVRCPRRHGERPHTDRPDLRIERGRLHHGLPVHAGRAARGRDAHDHRDLRRPVRLHGAGAHRQHRDGVEHGNGSGLDEQLGHGLDGARPRRGCRGDEVGARERPRRRDDRHHRVRAQPRPERRDGRGSEGRPAPGVPVRRGRAHAGRLRSGAAGCGPSGRSP